jgi:hypothetical protein
MHGRVEDQLVGGPKGLSRIGAIGARPAGLPENMSDVDGRKGVYDSHEHIKDVDLDGIGAAFLSPRLGLFTGAAPNAKN